MQSCDEYPAQLGLNLQFLLYLFFLDETAYLDLPVVGYVYVNIVTGSATQVMARVVLKKIGQSGGDDIKINHGKDWSTA